MGNLQLTRMQAADSETNTFQQILLSFEPLFKVSTPSPRNTAPRLEGGLCVSQNTFLALPYHTHSELQYVA